MLLVEAEASLWGNMAVVVSIASPIMVCRSLARPIMDGMISCGGSRVSSRRCAPADREEHRVQLRADHDLC
jgi:hypothetical protein